MPIKLTQCVACGSANLTELLDWGKMSLANNYNIKEKYSLKLNKCEECYHLQLDEAVEPEILFSDYPYFSGVAKTSLEFFKDIAELSLRLFPDAKTALDIASNDGSQLDAFKTMGLHTYGIDPAKNLCEVAKNKGHIIYCSMFPDIYAGKQQEFTYDIITAENVIAHTTNPLSFLNGCKGIMNDKSILILSTSQANLIVNTEYDTCYHEHISYFNTLSMKRLVERAGLVLEDVTTHSIHGTSYLFIIRKVKTPDPVERRIGVEDKCGLYLNETYKKWVDDCRLKASKTKQIIEDYRKKGYGIVGCGAAAKGITFLNISDTKVDFIVDTTPAKWYNTVCEAVIFPFEYLRAVHRERVLFIILAWNFADEIRSNILKHRSNPNDIFITTNQNIE